MITLKYGNLTGESAVFAASFKKIFNEPYGGDSKKRNLQDGEVIEFKSPMLTRNNIRFALSDDRELWLSQIQGLYFTIKQEGCNECDYPSFITKDGEIIKLDPFCDLNSFIEFVKNKKFKIQQIEEFYIKVSFSGTSSSECIKAHDKVFNEKGEFLGFDNLITYCLENLNNNNFATLQNGYFVSGKLYYFYEV